MNSTLGRSKLDPEHNQEILWMFFECFISTCTTSSRLVAQELCLSYSLQGYNGYRPRWVPIGFAFQSWPVGPWFGAAQIILLLQWFQRYASASCLSMQYPSKCRLHAVVLELSEAWLLWARLHTCSWSTLMGLAVPSCLGHVAYWLDLLGLGERVDAVGFHTSFLTKC